jgi:hypothetical protein
MDPTETKQAIRLIIIFTLLVNGLTWLGAIVGGGPTSPGLGLLVWGTAPFVAVLYDQTLFTD